MEKQTSWKELQDHYNSDVKAKHLKDLLSDQKRNAALTAEIDNLVYDFSHEKMTEKTLDLLDDLTKKIDLRSKIQGMFKGEHINSTEDRAVLHVALRAKQDQVIEVDGTNVVPAVHDVLTRLATFSDQVRDGSIKGFSGKKMLNTVVIGIGGSYLGIEFVYEGLRMHPDCQKSSEGRRLIFLANVDPNDFARATKDLNPEETIVVVNSKTFTTAETMLNARSIKRWFIEHYKKTDPNVNEQSVINAHVCACSTNLKETNAFGISDDRVFGFWDWVGGRYSVCSSIGMLPLSLQFGFSVMKKFLEGANNIDQHFLNTTETRKNIPLLLGLISFYQISCQGHYAKAICPYSQALCKFAPHIQQLYMESNGKRVNRAGEELPYECAIVMFGEPGTNGQHSFYQLLHQGRVTPVEFIGYCKAQTPVDDKSEKVSNQDELMSNFFSQPDALACGKTVDELKAEKVPEKLWGHKFFPGDRPSSQLLFDELTPYSLGQLLAIYEHRTAVEGFIWDINSFDQWGVELGKALAKEVRNFLAKNRDANSNPSFDGFSFNTATSSLLKRYSTRK